MDFKNVAAASKSVSCSSLFLLLFTFYLTAVLAHAARNPPPKPLYHVVNLPSLQPKSYCESHSEGSALGSEKIRMVSRYGPCSPDNRAKRISSSDELFQNENANDGSGFMEYLVTIGLGTPKIKYTVLVDTGSVNTWVRCQPCHSGCDSTDPLFDPSKSSTYVNGSCRHNDGVGTFDSHYADNSYSTGHWGCDTLTIEKSYVVRKFQFGCGQDNYDVGDNFAGHAGMLGLGRGELSLASQGGPKFGKFSYCFPKSDSQIGYLVFGSEAAKKSSSVNPKFTPLLPPPANLPKKYQGKSYYFVELIGISVAGKNLDVATSDFTSSGTIIDSGTSITQLPQEAYTALRTAFNQTMASKYPAAAAQKKMDTCYNVEGYDTSKFQVPDITFHFRGGADAVLSPSGIVITPGPNANVVCLGFTAKDQPIDLTIIGNHQQRQMSLFFDSHGNRVGFGASNCVE